MNKLEIQLFDEVYNFIDNLPESDKAKVLAHIKIMETDISVVHIKPLRNSIKELIVKKYRLIFFINKNTLYFVSGFIKKSQKTPVKEIDNAENIYKMIK